METGRGSGAGPSRDEGDRSLDSGTRPSRVRGGGPGVRGNGMGSPSQGSSALSGRY